MFTGVINEDMRKVLHEIVRGWDVEQIYVGCCGNFTVERILRDETRFKVYSNDVSIYSCAMGKYLVGEEFRLEVKDHRFDWLEPYIKSGEGKLATILLSLNLLDGYDRPEPFFKRKAQAYKTQWDTLYKNTLEKVRKLKENLKVDGYFAGDVLDFVKNVPDYSKSGFITFPPTYKGGYERLYKSLMETFDWDEPEYKIFDKDSLKELNDIMMNFGYWCTSKDAKIPELEDYEVAKVQTSLRSKPVYIYASNGKTRLSAPRIKVKQLPIERFGMEDRITEDSQIRLVKIEPQQMNLLRSLYLDPKIAPATPAISLAVLVDNKLIGAIGLSDGKYGIAEAYLMSDFAIEPVPYKRMSKLVLSCTLSKEVKDIVEKSFVGKYEKIFTTAFTSNPVSMKYRGLYEVYNRKTDPPQVNYQAQMGRWTLQEALQWWNQKYNKQ